MIKNSERPIKELAEVSSEYARLCERRAELVNRAAELDKESRDIQKFIAEEQSRDFHKERINAIVDGINYEPPLDVREKRAKIAEEKRDIEDALHRIAVRIAAEHRSASRIVTSEFESDHLECAAEFYTHIAAAVVAHNRFGKMRLRLERAGIDTTGLNDFGHELFGHPGDKNNDAGYALRDALKRGYIAQSAMPPLEYR